MIYDESERLSDETEAETDCQTNTEKLKIDRNPVHSTSLTMVDEEADSTTWGLRTIIIVMSA